MPQCGWRAKCVYQCEMPDLRGDMESVMRVCVADGDSRLVGASFLHTHSSLQYYCPTRAESYQDSCERIYRVMISVWNIQR